MARSPALSELVSQSKAVIKMPETPAVLPQGSATSTDAKDMDSKKADGILNTLPQVIEPPPAVSLPRVTSFAAEYPLIANVTTFLFTPAAYPYIVLILLAGWTHEPKVIEVLVLPHSYSRHLRLAWETLRSADKGRDGMLLSSEVSEPCFKEYFEHGQVSPMFKLAFIFAVCLPILEQPVLMPVRNALLRLVENIFELGAKILQEVEEEKREREKESKRKMMRWAGGMLVEALRELEKTEDTDTEGSEFYNSCYDSDDTDGSDDSDNFDEDDCTDDENSEEEEGLVHVERPGLDMTTIRSVVDTVKIMQGRL